MATYVNNLRLTELATGEGSGTWGTTTNTNLELIGEALGYGSEAIANASTHTITVADGTADSARSFYLKLTGGGQACTVTLAPNTLSKVWMVENTTNSTLTFSQGSGANVAVPAGQVKMIATDGAGSGAVVYDLLVDTDLTGTTTVVNLTSSGTIDAATVEFNSLSGTGSVAITDILDQDNMSSNSATALATQQSIKAYVDSSVASFDTLAEVLAQGNTTGGTDIVMSAGDNITNASGDLTIDVAGSIKLDADSSNIYLSDGGTDIGLLSISSQDLNIRNLISDKDIYFQGNDNGSNFTALTLDMSNAGAASFNSNVTVASTLLLSPDGNNDLIKSTGGVLYLKANELSVQNNSGVEFIGNSSAGTIFNNGSADLNFRVESNGNANMLFVDGGNDKIGIGNAAPSTTLEVTGNGDAETGITVTHSRSGVGNTILLNNTNNGANKGSGVKWRSGGFDTGAIITRSDAVAASGDAPAYMTFHTSSDGTEDLTERLRLSSTGAATFSSSVTAGGQITSARGSDTGTYGFRHEGADKYMRMGVANASFAYFETDANGGFSFENDVSVVSKIIHAGDTNTYIEFQSDVFDLYSGGSLGVRIQPTTVTINEAGSDYDFRVESDSNANMLFVDGGNNRVGVGTAAPQSIVHIDQGASGDAQLTLETHAAGDSKLVFSQGQTAGNWAVGYDDGGGVTENSLSFAYKADGYPSLSGQNKMVLTPTGNLGLGLSAPLVPLHVQSTSAGELLRLESTDAGGTLGPIVGLYRNSASPAAGDNLGAINFYGEDTAGNITTYAAIESETYGVSNGAEAGRLHFKVCQSASLVSRFYMNFGETVVNESGENLDFRVEGDSQTHALFVDASTSRVGIHDSAPSYPLEVNGTARIRSTLYLGSSSSDPGNLSINDNSGTAYTLSLKGTATREYTFEGSSSGGAYNLYFNNADVASGMNVHFYGGANFNQNGDNFDFRVESANNANMFVVDASTDSISLGNLKVAIYASDTNSGYIADGGNVGIRFSQPGVDDIVPCDTSGGDRDNGINFGSSGARWGTIFAATGTINTSDQNEKQDIAELSEAEQRVAVAAKGLLRKFRWKDSVAEKGDAARTHVGIMAQDLQAAFAAEGLDASDYAMWCSDTWTDKETGEEHTRLGVRYSELLAFIISAI